jgi:predicted nucleotidyltransferase
VALKRQADAIRALGVASLYLFGSTLLDGATAAGDLDLFVDYDLARRFRSSSWLASSSSLNVASVSRST